MGFKKLEQTRNKFKKEILEAHQDQLITAKNAVAASSYANSILNQHLYHTSINSGVKLHGPRALISMISIKNTNLLYSACYLIPENLVNPAYTLVRATFEGIQKEYVLALEDDMAEKLFNQDMEYDGKFVRFSDMRQHLYEGERLDKISKLYAELSKKVHPNIKGINNDNEYNFPITEDLLCNVILFSFLNIRSIQEIYWCVFSKEEKKKLYSLAQNFPQEYHMMTMTPNRQCFPNIDENDP
ncbi:MAG: hypothetical protein ACQESG_03420 [Nanobdellota archaeon]